MDNIFDKKIYDANFSVVKHNTMVESGYDLPPVQNNVMNIAAVKAREVTDPELWNGEVIISAQEYSDIHSVTLNDAYKVLKKSALEMKEIELICDAYYDFSKGEIVPDLPESIEAANFYSETIVASKPKHGNYKKMKVHIRLIDKIGYSDPHCQNSCHPHLNNLNGEKGDNHGTIQCRTQTGYTKQTFIT